MRRELLIAAGPGEWRAALLEDGVAVELYIERGDTHPPGSVHLGRVVRRAPGLDSAFVEIGDARPGLLPAREASADGIRLDEGTRVIVEVRREAQQDKGARLSTRIRPSRRLGLDGLRRQAADADPPVQLYPAAGFAPALALRLPDTPDRVLTDDPAVVPELRQAFASVEIGISDEQIDIDSAIDVALGPSLSLPNGGTVHIQQARGATVIDVDTGNPAQHNGEAGALAANLTAAALIARQIRLRNLGGGIVIDFVGLEGQPARERVKAALAAACRADPLEPRVLGWTRLGHLELVRPRRSRSLADAMLDPGNDAASPRRPIALAHEALCLLQRQARAQPAANWTLQVSPPIASALSGAANVGLRTLEARLGRRIEIVEATDQAGFDIAPR